ncbi:alpha/beta hydrolase, partial [Lactobacillus sp. XV13L]|nr:alpha/beta hydrolase [Lactobacillus sp. XV13L]
MIHQAHFIANDGVRLHYYDTQSAKQPLVMLPGIGSSAQLWRKSIALFSSKFRVVVLDPRNQGRSERTYKGQRISRHAADLEQVMQRLKLTNAIGIGNSMGAANLWAYLSLYGADRFQALVDLDQPPKMVADQTWPFGFKDLTWA